MIPYYLLILMLVSLLFLIYTKYTKFTTASIILKTTTSLLFISICISSEILHEGNSPYFFFILIALTLSLIGDVFLAFPINISYGHNKYFKRGLISFTFAHVFFSVAFISLTGFTFKDILLFLILSLILFIILKYLKGFNYNGMLPFVILYCSVISFMVSKALSIINIINFNSGALLIVIGAAFFFISDIILSFIYFYEKPIKPLTALNLITYYIGQGLIALSLLYF